MGSGRGWGLPWRSGPWRATETAMDMGQRGETISSDQPICAWSSNSPERQGAVAREIAGKHSPKAIYSSYFQTNTQTFMLAVLAAVLKLALIKSVRVCVLKERESRGRGDSCIPGLFFFFCGHTWCFTCTYCPSCCKASL